MKIKFDDISFDFHPTERKPLRILAIPTKLVRMDFLLAFLIILPE